MQSGPLMKLRLSAAPLQDIGAGPRGTRFTFPITGGSFEGERLRGKALVGGDDWTVNALRDRRNLLIVLWRRGWDSNPKGSHQVCDLQNPQCRSCRECQ